MLESKYLVDTNILIDILHDQKTVVELMKKISSDSNGIVYVSDITVSELYAGTPPHRFAEAETLLTFFTYLPASRQAARQAGIYIYTWGRKGVTIHIGDALQSGLCKTENLSLVTRNKKHFPMSDIEIISPESTDKNWLGGDESDV